MKKINTKLLTIGLALYALGTTIPSNACMTTVFNDGHGSILVVDHNDASNKNSVQAPGNILFIPKNQSRRFGKAHEKSHFTLYSKPAKSHVFTAIYEVKQNECGKNGNPLIKLSDLKSNTGDTHLFTITPITKTYSSMVRELPTMQRPDIFKEETSGGCSACNSNK
jgi:hypothetical protein